MLMRLTFGPIKEDGEHVDDDGACIEQGKEAQARLQRIRLEGQGAHFEINSMQDIVK